jgi:hypothetical protein
LFLVTCGLGEVIALPRQTALTLQELVMGQEISLTYDAAGRVIGHSKMFPPDSIVGTEGSANAPAGGGLEIKP